MLFQPSYVTWDIRMGLAHTTQHLQETNACYITSWRTLEYPLGHQEDIKGRISYLKDDFHGLLLVLTYQNIKVQVSYKSCSKSNFTMQVFQMSKMMVFRQQSPILSLVSYG